MESIGKIVQSLIKINIQNREQVFSIHLLLAGTVFYSKNWRKRF